MDRKIRTVNPRVLRVAYGVKSMFSTGLSRLGELTESYLAEHWSCLIKITTVSHAN